jgi:hypothetical protein
MCGECGTYYWRTETFEGHMQRAHDMSKEESQTYVAAVKLITEMTPA